MLPWLDIYIFLYDIKTDLKYTNFNFTYKIELLTHMLHIHVSVYVIAWITNSFRDILVVKILNAFIFGLQVYHYVIQFLYRNCVDRDIDKSV